MVRTILVIDNGPPDIYDPSGRIIAADGGPVRRALVPYQCLAANHGYLVLIELAVRIKISRKSRLSHPVI